GQGPCAAAIRRHHSPTKRKYLQGARAVESVVHDLGRADTPAGDDQFPCGNPACAGYGRLGSAEPTCRGETSGGLIRTPPCMFIKCPHVEKESHLPVRRR